MVLLIKCPKAAVSFVIPSTVVEIGEYAFFGCSHLTSVIIPDSVTTIDDTAFYNTFDLEYVFVPSSVTSIGSANWSHDDDWETVIGCYPGSTAHTYAVENGILYMLLLPATPDFYLPTGTTTIGVEAFSGIAAQYVQLPESVTTIGSKAFTNCPNLMVIYIPDSCTSIAADAFDGVSALIIYCHDGSYAEFYTTKHENISCVIVP